MATITDTKPTVINALKTSECAYEYKMKGVYSFPCGLEVATTFGDKPVGFLEWCFKQAHLKHHDKGHNKSPWLIVETVDYTDSSVTVTMSCNCPKRRQDG